MWGLILAILSVTIVLITSIILYVEQEKLKSETNKKFNNIVNQINDSQFYSFNFDKQQEENIKNVDRNATTVNESIINLQNNIKNLDAITLKKDSIRNNVTTENVQTNNLSLGDRFKIIPGEDNWIKFFDRSGSEYFGGIASKNLSVEQNSYLKGITTIGSQLTVNGRTALKGGKTLKNLDTVFADLDGKNYIRGNTDVLGKITNDGGVQTNKLKVNSSSEWTDDDPVISSFAQAGKTGASFSGDQYSSLFPAKDGTTYIRPGADNKSIVIGDVGKPTIKIGESWFPSINNDTYIRPGVDGANIHIGDVWASKVNIGNRNTRVNITGPIKINGSIQLCDLYGNNCRTL